MKITNTGMSSDLGKIVILILESFMEVSDLLSFGKVCINPSSLAKGYDPLYSSSPLASLDGFS